MQFIDVAAIHQESRVQIEEAIARVISHGRFINGPEVQELEEVLGSFLNGTNAIAVSSGTMALEIALRALGIGPGDEVITTPFTWISTAETIALVGARPVFVDIEPDYYNIDVDLLEPAINEKTKAIIPVNLFGQMADYGKLLAIADKYTIPIIEDAAQSLGARQGELKSCSVGTISCTSFFPAKPLGCYGDGGAVFTRDNDLAAVMRAIVNHGGKTRGEHAYVGTNGRCDTLQAAILLAKFPAFREEIGLRDKLGERYSKNLKDCCVTPAIMSGNSHVYAQYTICPKNRDTLASSLKEKGIPTAVYYRKCLHQQQVFRPLGYGEGSFPVAEKASREVISLPMSPYLSSSDQDQIIEAVKECETNG